MNWVKTRLRHFLGFKSTPVAATKAQTIASLRRTHLVLQELESRNLLAALLPAPSASLILHPADNPVLPAAFDVFNPPIANIAAASAAPQLAKLTEQANPDDSLAATGVQFSNLVGPSAGQDTVFEVYGQTSPSNGSLTNATVQELNGDRAAFTLSSSLPQKSMYLVWAQNAAGASLPLAVNKTQAWWIGPNAATPGATVSVYGQNLSNGAGTPQSWIYLQPSQGQGRWINPTAVNPYKVDFVVPTDLAFGSYQIWVHNGHGGQFGWSSPVTLTVQAPIGYGNVVVKLANFGGLPNTGTDAAPAFTAAIAAIGFNSGTIQLQAGTYYLSAAPLQFTGGFNAGIYLQGAGKNATIIKALPGFVAGYFMSFGPDSKVSDLTMDATGATLQNTSAIACTNLTNVKIISRGYEDINGTGLPHFQMTNSDLIGGGVFFSTSNQILINGCNFYATDQTVSLVYIWSGDGISVTNCTAQDYNLQSPDLNDHGAGRFFTGSGIWGTQSDVYIGDNTTNHFAPPPNYYNQNSGEQIMWEINQASQSNFAASATGNSVTLSTLGGDYAGREAVVVAGRGIGQHRQIVSTDFATGGTTLTLDSPWNVVPDGTTQISIITAIKRAVVYHNTLQGNSNFSVTSASMGFELFSGGLDIVVDRNTMSDFQYGISDIAYSGDPSFTGRRYTLPAFFNLYENNTIINTGWGIRSMDDGAIAGETATLLGNVYRNNTMSGIHNAGWYVQSGYSPIGETTDLEVFEHNQVSDAPRGIDFFNPGPTGPVSLVVYKNVFNRGAAALAGSQAIAPQSIFVMLLSGNSFLNFLNPQNPSGTIYSRLPTFSWNAIPGADHYDVWIQDLSTGQSPVLRNASIQGTSWTTAAQLTANHAYRWWVEALGPGGVVSNWSASQDFYLAALGTPLVISPVGISTYVSPASLTPAFTWSGVGAADSYDVWVNDVTTGQSQVLRQTTTNLSLVSFASLTLGHQYQWWVRALNNSGNYGSWSSGFSFAAVMTVPTSIGPTGALINATPTFSWGNVAGATSYDVWVDDTSTGQSQVLRAPLTGSQIVTGTNWAAPSALRPGDSYKWWVRAMNNTGTPSSWTSGISFTVALLAAPVPATPIPQDSGLTLSWNSVAGADYYDVWVDDLTAGTSQYLRNTQVIPNSLAMTTTTVGHTYQWWVRALSNNGNYSPWSVSARSGILSAPVPIGPSGPAQSAGLTITWNAVAGADYYSLWLYDLTTNTTVLPQNTRVTGTSLQMSTLTAGHSYRWWVRAVSNAGSYSYWSTSLDFVP